MTPSETNDGIDVLSTNAYLAVGVLADAIGPDTYHGRDVAEAIDHLRTGLEAGAKDTEAGRRIETALEYLSDMEEYALPEDKKPAVPVLYHVPRGAVDRAIRRFQRRRENNPTPERRTRLEETIE